MAGYWPRAKTGLPNIELSWPHAYTEKQKAFIQIIPEENNLGELRLELNSKTVRISGKSLTSSSEMISLQLPKQMVSALWLKYVIASGQNIACARLSDSIVGTY